MTVNAEECGKKGFTKIATVMTIANGAWNPAAKPTLNTTYQAGWKATKSVELVVEGRARRRAQAHQARALLGLADGDESFVGNYVVLQRFVPARRAWKRVKNIALKTVKPGVAPAMVSSAGFNARVVRRTRLRLVLTPSAGRHLLRPGAQHHRQGLGR